MDDNSQAKRPPPPPLDSRFAVTPDRSLPAARPRDGKAACGLFKIAGGPPQTGHHPGNVSGTALRNRGPPGFDIFRKNEKNLSPDPWRE